MQNSTFNKYHNTIFCGYYIWHLIKIIVIPASEKHDKAVSPISLYIIIELYSFIFSWKDWKFLFFEPQLIPSN